MTKWKALLSTVGVLAIFVVFQIRTIKEHDANRHRVNDANIKLFTENFDLLTVSRTVKHEKGIEYWFDWIEHESGFLVFNKTLTLLHFDAQAMDDNANEPMHICTAPNLLIYDFFVKRALDTAYSAYFDDFSPMDNASVTRHALRKGYVDNLVWIYPDHWRNYSQSTVANVSFKAFQTLIRHQTFFIAPVKPQFFYLETPTNVDNEIWASLFAKDFERVENEQEMHPNHSLRVDVWSLTLSEYLNEPHFQALGANNLILDVDLDFFSCIEPAATFMDHFGWGDEEGLASRFNHILRHHQYVPTHVFSERSNEAVLTLLHLLLNDNDPTIADITVDRPLFPFVSVEWLELTAPRIEDVFEIALEERMDVPTIERAMYLLFEYQLERSQFQPDAAQHLTHFDDVFEILHLAHRRLAEINVIEYRDSQEATHALKRPYHSQHRARLKKIALKQYKAAHFGKQKMESQRIRDIQENVGTVHQQFDDFAERLVDFDEHHRAGSPRSLLTTEIEADGTQKVTDDDGDIDAEQHRVYHTEWEDYQIKDVMNMTTEYLYHGWHKVLFGEYDGDVSWKDNYPQWTSDAISEDDDDETLFTEGASNLKAPHNQDRDRLKMHDKVPDEHLKQAQFVLRLDALDPMQLHILQRAHHSRLKEFVDALDEKQSEFLRWLIFCYYHAVKCSGAKYLPRRFNRSRHFGEDFVWYELNGWPKLSEENDKSEALQLQIGRYHNQFRKFIAAEPNEIAFVPQSEQLNATLTALSKVLSADNANVLIVGIEHSPGHIPKPRRKELECKVFKVIQEAAYDHNGNRHSFVRITKMERDGLISYPVCSNLK